MAAGTAVVPPTLSVSSSDGGRLRSCASPASAIRPVAGPDTGPDTVAASFLGLPLELRLEIYRYLLIDPSNAAAAAAAAAAAIISKPNPASTTSHHNQNQHQPPPSPVVKFPSPHAAAILRTSRQIHAEAAPVLYTSHVFLAHPSSLLTHFPRLSPQHAPVQHAEHSPLLRRLITRYRIQVRLDVDPKFTRADATRHFSGKDELVVEVSQASWRGSGPDHMRLFEGVRGVRKSARVTGSTSGFEGYARWLERSMMAPEGSRVEGYAGPMELGFDRVEKRRGGARAGGSDGDGDGDDDDNGSATGPEDDYDAVSSSADASVLSSSWGSSATTSSSSAMSSRR